MEFECLQNRPLITSPGAYAQLIVFKFVVVYLQSDAVFDKTETWFNKGQSQRDLTGEQQG